MKKFITLLFLLSLSVSPVYAGDYETGLKAFNQGHYSISKALFEKAVKTNPKDINARYMLSQVYIKEGNLTAAKAQYKYIIGISPNSQAGIYAKQGLMMIEKQTTSSNSNSTYSAPKQNIIQTDTVKTANASNQVLRYYYYVPSNLQNSSGYPIIFYLPGLGGNGKDMIHEGVQDFANKNGFAIASITFKFNEKDFNAEKSYQYPSAWSGQAFKDVLAKLKTKNVNFKDIYLVGFSAGGQFASRFAIENPGFLKGCAILSSGARVLPDKKQSTKFFFAVGGKDSEYHVKNQTMFVENAKKLGIDVTGKVYTKMGHATSSEEDRDVENFILETQNKK